MQSNLHFVKCKKVKKESNPTQAEESYPTSTRRSNHTPTKNSNPTSTDSDSASTDEPNLHPKKKQVDRFFKVHPLFDAIRNRSLLLPLPADLVHRRIHGFLQQPDGCIAVHSREASRTISKSIKVARRNTTMTRAPEEYGSEIDEPLPIQYPVSKDESTTQDSNPCKHHIKPELPNNNISAPKESGSDVHVDEKLSIDHPVFIEDGIENWRNLAEKPLKKKRTNFSMDGAFNSLNIASKRAEQTENKLCRLDTNDEIWQASPIWMDKELKAIGREAAYVITNKEQSLGLSHFDWLVMGSTGGLEEPTAQCRTTDLVFVTPPLSDPLNVTLNGPNLSEQ
ncbi:hypothetical protein V9T40_001172 [Parthenolecanium corni]|uniref:Uncharacterized protein n=1 Tax=Parthenolecanium corni TaxID=536013 RepID=A0AAN9Y2G1_9HEMI